MLTNNISSFLRSICCTLFCLFFICNSSNAEELSDNFQFNGFFTLDATVTDQDLALTSNSDNKVFYEENTPSLKNSLIGAQLSYSFTDDFTAVMQAKLYDEGGTQDPSKGSIAQLDWAYISYDFGADFKIRAGQFLIPFMQGTELRSIGFSRLWARPLIPNSGAGGYKEYVGVELLKHYPSGNGNWDFQFSVGQAEHSLSRIDNKHMELLSVRYQQDNFWVRAALLSTQYDIYTTSNFLIKDSASAVMFSTELEYTLNDFVLNAGYTQSKTDITPDGTNYYISLAYNFDAITPYVSYSRGNQYFELFTVPTPIRSEPPTAPNDEPLPPPPPTPPNGDVDIYHLSVGARYNFSERYAVKIQLEHINEENKANFPDDNGEGNALSIVLEGIF